MDNGISIEEDYHFQGQKGDYCKPKTKVMYIFFRHIFIFVFMLIIWLLKYILFYFFWQGISIKSSKRISNDGQIAFRKLHFILWLQPCMFLKNLNN